jgi:hypothetical protein
LPEHARHHKDVSMSHIHLTAPTRFVEVNGHRLAYRRWGNTDTDQPPLFFLQHFGADRKLSHF